MKKFFGNQHVSPAKVTWKHRIKFTVKVMAVMCLMGWSAYFASMYFPAKVYAEKEVDISEQILQGRIEILKLSVVNDISKCENPTQNEGQIIFDTNHAASIGLFMFQTKTVKYYEDKLYGKKFSDKEANDLALNGGASRDLAEAIMFTTPSKASTDWKICAARVNADRRIDMIKMIEDTK